MSSWGLLLGLSVACQLQLWSFTSPKRAVLIIGRANQHVSKTDWTPKLECYSMISWITRDHSSILTLKAWPVAPSCCNLIFKVFKQLDCYTWCISELVFYKQHVFIFVQKESPYTFSNIYTLNLSRIHFLINWPFFFFLHQGSQPSVLLLGLRVEKPLSWSQNRKKMVLVSEVLGSTTSAGLHTLYLKVKSYKTKSLSYQGP